MSSRDVAHSNIRADLSAQIFEHFPVVYATDIGQQRSVGYFFQKRRKLLCIFHRLGTSYLFRIACFNENDPFYIWPMKQKTWT